MARLLALSMVAVIVVVAVVAFTSAPSNDSPAWAIVLVGLAGVAVLGAIAWARNYPVSPGDEAAYGRVAVVKLALAEGAALIGFVVAVILGPWWVTLIGGGFALAGLGLSWPSKADRERHELLYLI